MNRCFKNGRFRTSNSEKKSSHTGHSDDSATGTIPVHGRRAVAGGGRNVAVPVPAPVPGAVRVGVSVAVAAVVVAETEAVASLAV